MAERGVRAGKTTVAEVLCGLAPGVRLFDPEYVGFLLRRFVPVPTGDFQDLPVWRELVVAHLAGLVRHHPGVWVVPMTLLHPGYRAEVLGGLRRAGVPVRQCVLRSPRFRLVDHGRSARHAARHTEQVHDRRPEAGRTVSRRRRR